MVDARVLAQVLQQRPMAPFELLEAFGLLLQEIEAG
jgi:hypothetical protein